MNKRLLLSTLFLLTLFASIAQEYSYMYRLWLSNKAHNSYSIEKPEAFLSQRSIERRNRLGIAIDERDLPVSEFYINEIEKTGAHIIVTSRWLNTVVVALNDTSLLKDIEAYDFVVKSRCVWMKMSETNEYTHNKKRIMECLQEASDVSQYIPRQLQEINLDKLHAAGYSGEGMLIAVTDVGFSKLNENTSIYPHKIIATKSFLESDFTFDSTDNHGCYVTSIMASNVADSYVGSAPNAQYLLIETEDPNSEFPVEEDRWIAGAEWADSVGVDVINVSLGYHAFDNPDMNYTTDVLDGKTANMSIAAGIASQKGILVVAAAGNEGNFDWKKLNVPADAFGILTVGGIDKYGNSSSFSSRGYTSDGRIKPDVVARATKTEIYTPDKSIIESNGTSFASPIIAGAAACLWQAHPDWSVEKLIDMIQRSASLYNNPNPKKGYGLPDFFAAYNEFAHLSTPQQHIELYTCNHTLYLPAADTTTSITLYNTQGCVVWQQTIPEGCSSIALDAIESGLYIITIATPHTHTTQKIIIQ